MLRPVRRLRCIGSGHPACTHGNAPCLPRAHGTHGTRAARCRLDVDLMVAPVSAVICAQAAVRNQSMHARVRHEHLVRAQAVAAQELEQARASVLLEAVGPEQSPRLEAGSQGAFTPDHSHLLEGGRAEAPEARAAAARAARTGVAAAGAALSADVATAPVNARIDGLREAATQAESRAIEMDRRADGTVRTLLEAYTTLGNLGDLVRLAVPRLAREARREFVRVHRAERASADSDDDAHDRGDDADGGDDPGHDNEGEEAAEEVAAMIAANANAAQSVETVAARLPMRLWVCERALSHVLAQLDAAAANGRSRGAAGGAAAPTESSSETEALMQPPAELPSATVATDHAAAARPSSPAPRPSLGWTSASARPSSAGPAAGRGGAPSASTLTVLAAGKLQRPSSALGPRPSEADGRLSTRGPLPSATPGWMQRAEPRAGGRGEQVEEAEEATADEACVHHSRRRSGDLSLRSDRSPKRGAGRNAARQPQPVESALSEREQRKLDSINFAAREVERREREAQARGPHQGQRGR